MSPNARAALLLVALILTITAVVLDIAGVATREWWKLALPAIVAVILVFLLVREARVR